MRRRAATPEHVDDERPISYLALTVGTAVLSSSGQTIGTVEHVLQIPEEDLFDGIVLTLTGAFAASTGSASIVYTAPGASTTANAVYATGSTTDFAASQTLLPL
jgi:hypothetical protein